MAFSIIISLQDRQQGFFSLRGQRQPQKSNGRISVIFPAFINHPQVAVAVWNINNPIS
jgi:hypothetical protein